MKKPKPVENHTIERRIKRLINQHQLARIEAVFTGSKVIVRAMPAAYGALVTKRRQEAFAALEAKGVTSLTSPEATEINNEAQREAARGEGPDLATATHSLSVALEEAAK